MVSGNNTRKGNCIVRCELLKAVEDSNVLFRVVMIENIDSNRYQPTEYSDRELVLYFSVSLAKGQNTLNIRLYELPYTVFIFPQNFVLTFYFTIVWPCIVTDSLWIKPTDALNSSFIGIITLHASGSLSAHHQEILVVHRLWYIL